MTSMHGLPPLPRSLSHEAARVNGMDQSGVDWSSGGGPSARPERKGRTLPTPPATLSQNGETPRPLRHVTATSEETKSIETNLATLRDEMVIALSFSIIWSGRLRRGRKTPRRNRN